LVKKLSRCSVPSAAVIVTTINVILWPAWIPYQKKMLLMLLTEL